MTSPKALTSDKDTLQAVMYAKMAWEVNIGGDLDVVVDNLAHVPGKLCPMHNNLVLQAMLL